MRLLWGCHRIDTNAVRLEFQPGHIRGLRVGKDPLDLRRVVRRHHAEANVAPRHVGRQQGPCRLGRVQIRDEEQVGRAVVPETSVDAPGVERLVCDRDLGIGDERLDNLSNDGGEGGRCAFDGRYVTRRRRVLIGDRSWRGVSMYSKRTTTFGHTCRAMGERGYAHSSPFLTRWSRIPVTALGARSQCAKFKFCKLTHAALPKA
jgi:hypothetical protein